MNEIILLYISDSNKSSSSPVVFTDIPFNSQQVSFSVSLSNYNSFNHVFNTEWKINSYIRHSEGSPLVWSQIQNYW